MVQMVRLCPRGWWRQRPFLPVPRADYIEFRLVTQYGGDPATSGIRPAVHDVLDYLRWCRAWNRRGRGPRGGRGSSIGSQTGTR